MASEIASPRFICQGHSGYSLVGPRRATSTRAVRAARRRGAGAPPAEARYRSRRNVMKRWESDPGLRRLVREKREGVLDRRAFLARLGGATAGAAAASLIGGA